MMSFEKIALAAVVASGLIATQAKYADAQHAQVPSNVEEPTRADKADQAPWNFGKSSNKAATNNEVPAPNNTTKPD